MYILMMVQIRALVLWLMSLKDFCPACRTLVRLCLILLSVNLQTFTWTQTLSYDETQPFNLKFPPAWPRMPGYGLILFWFMTGPEGNPILSSKGLCCAAPGGGRCVNNRPKYWSKLCIKWTKLCVCIWVDIGTGPIVRLCCVHYNKGGEENAGGRHFLHMGPIISSYTSVLGEGSRISEVDAEDTSPSTCSTHASAEIVQKHM